MAGVDNCAILQDSAANAKDVPPEIRTGFVVKVYALVMTMLLISFGLASPAVFAHDWATKFLQVNPWVMWVCLGFLLIQHAFHMCLMMDMICGGGGCMKCYLRMFVTVPFNFLYLATYAVFMGGVLGIIMMAYEAESVIFVFCLCVFIILGLTMYAFYTKADFTGMGAYILVAVLGLIAISFMGMFVPIGSLLHRIIGGIGATIFGFIIVYDTQLIFGSASAEGTSRKYEYTIDMYAFAAFELYLDFVNFFIYMLRLLGARR